MLHVRDGVPALMLKSPGGLVNTHISVVSVGTEWATTNFVSQDLAAKHIPVRIW